MNFDLSGLSGPCRAPKLIFLLVLFSTQLGTSFNNIHPSLTIVFNRTVGVPMSVTLGDSVWVFCDRHFWMDTHQSAEHPCSKHSQLVPQSVVEPQSAVTPASSEFCGLIKASSKRKSKVSIIQSSLFVDEQVPFCPYDTSFLFS